MYDVVKVVFENSNRIYFFSNNKLDLKKGDNVVVELENGLQFGSLVSNVISVEEEKLFFPLRNVLRIATKDDLKINKINQELAIKALNDAKKISKQLNLDMNFLSASFTFNKSQLLLSFIADDRIDFRDLAKKMASIYKTRIELRQIGVRDKAKSVGGIGPCGRFLCCSSFLNDFESVSINMAKNQYISLKPDKINGICGRLLCCLNYEDEQYTEMKKSFPLIGSIVKLKDYSGKVVSHNLISNKFTIETKDKMLVEVDIKEYESNK